MAHTATEAASIRKAFAEGACGRCVAWHQTSRAAMPEFGRCRRFPGEGPLMHELAVCGEFVEASARSAQSAPEPAVPAKKKATRKRAAKKKARRKG